MIIQNSSQSDLLNRIGQAFLTVDTRWIFVGALLFVGVFWLVVKYKKQRDMSREDAMSLGLAVLQLYSAPVLFSMLVLTQPPAVDLVSNVQRQGAGLLAFIFLVAGVFIQIKKLWTTSG